MHPCTHISIRSSTLPIYPDTHMPIHPYPCTHAPRSSVYPLRTIATNSFFRNWVNVRQEATWNVNGGENLLGKIAILKNLTHALIGDGVKCRNGCGPQAHVYMSDKLTQAQNLRQRDQTVVFGYPGPSNRPSQIFYLAQAPGAVMEASGPFKDQRPIIGCPKAGLTNQACWDQYGVAYAGDLASCDHRQAHVHGYVCPLKKGVEAYFARERVLGAPQQTPPLLTHCVAGSTGLTSTRHTRTTTSHAQTTTHRDNVAQADSAEDAVMVVGSTAIFVLAMHLM